ncbi:OmpA family protein [Roseivivax sediminis]|uniref:Outer membrane protein OmpA n=1 Tax=Roseivivax sediminis TaxID=936889 RepID=A0A1I1YFX8_9RHOB|nr:OmpA family protein [Roseivivax sediminis]SFE18212.1 Outer membrane protein OmpA [Roseivivax sediminis]
MKPGILKTSTALALSLSLVVPAPVLAQEQEPGQEMTDEQRRQFLLQQRENAEEAESQSRDQRQNDQGRGDGQGNGQGQGAGGQESPQAEQPAPEAQPDPQEQAEPQGQGSGQPETEGQDAAPEPQSEAAPEVREDPEPQAAPEQEAPAQPETVTEPEPQQTDPQGQAGSAATDESRTGADELRESLGAGGATTESAEQDAPAATAADDAPAEGDAPSQGDDPAAAERPLESEEPAAAEAPAESDDPAESNAPAATEAPAESDDPAGESAETPDEGTAPAAAGEDVQSSEAEEDASSVDELRERMRSDGEGESAEGEAADETAQQDPQDEAQTAERRQQDADALAEQDRAAQSTAAAQEGTDGAEVVEETITDETARSSNEEFGTAVDENVERQERRDDDDDDEDDGERAEKLRTFFGGAAAGALGAVALDRILQPNEEVVSDTGDRIVVERDGQYRVLRNDDALLRQPGANVTSYQYDDGSTRSVVIREDGTEIETIRAADGRVLRRVRTLPSGDQVVLFDDTQSFREVSVSELPQVSEQRQMIEYRGNDQQDLANALANAGVQTIDRSFSLNQVRNIAEVRKQVPEINVDSVNFETGSAVIRPEEAEALSALGNAMRDIIDERPGEVFLIEGHTDAVGSASMNLALSDRRAESVALALTEYFDVPPENMVVQGYGESDLLVRTEDAERANRRAAVRRITPLLTAAQQQ